MKAFFHEVVVPAVITAVAELVCGFISVFLAFSSFGIFGFIPGIILFLPISGLFIWNVRAYKRELQPCFTEHFGRFLAQLLLAAGLVVGCFLLIQMLYRHELYGLE